MAKLFDLYKPIKDKPNNQLNEFKIGEFDHIFLFFFEYEYVAYTSGTGIMILSDAHGCGQIEALEGPVMDLFLHFVKARIGASASNYLRFIIDYQYQYILQQKKLSHFALTELALMRYILYHAAAFDYEPIEVMAMDLCELHVWQIMPEYIERYSFIRDKFNCLDFSKVGYPSSQNRRSMPEEEGFFD